MQKLILRIIALSLISCLVVDSTIARASVPDPALGRTSILQNGLSEAVFQDQALMTGMGFGGRLALLNFNAKARICGVVLSLLLAVHVVLGFAQAPKQDIFLLERNAIIRELGSHDIRARESALGKLERSKDPNLWNQNPTPDQPQTLEQVLINNLVQGDADRAFEKRAAALLKHASSEHLKEGFSQFARYSTARLKALYGLSPGEIETRLNTLQEFFPKEFADWQGGQEYKALTDALAAYRQELIRDRWRPWVILAAIGFLVLVIVTITTWLESRALGSTVRKTGAAA